MAQQVLVVLVTCPPAAARKLARGLVSDRVAACVNILPRLSSCYRWRGRLRQDAESLLIIKTTRRRFKALKDAVLQRHPYELPEVIAVSVARGHAPYLDWVAQSTLPNP